MDVRFHTIAIGQLQLQLHTASHTMVPITWILCNVTHKRSAYGKKAIGQCSTLLRIFSERPWECMKRNCWYLS